MNINNKLIKNIYENNKINIYHKYIILDVFYAMFKYTTNSYLKKILVKYILGITNYNSYKYTDLNISNIYKHINQNFHKIIYNDNDIIKYNILLNKSFEHSISVFEIKFINNRRLLITSIKKNCVKKNIINHIFPNYNDYISYPSINVYIYNNKTFKYELYKHFYGIEVCNKYNEIILLDWIS